MIVDTLRQQYRMADHDGRDHWDPKDNEQRYYGRLVRVCNLDGMAPLRPLQADDGGYPSGEGEHSRRHNHGGCADDTPGRRRMICQRMNLQDPALELYANLKVRTVTSDLGPKPLIYPSQVKPPRHINIRWAMGTGFAEIFEGDECLHMWNSFLEHPHRAFFIRFMALQELAKKWGSSLHHGQGINTGHSSCYSLCSGRDRLKLICRWGK